MFGKDGSKNNGLIMMLKGFGINPDEIGAQFQAYQEQATKVVQHFDAALKRIEAAQSRIEAALERLEKANVSQLPAPPESAVEIQEQDTWPTLPTKS